MELRCEAVERYLPEPRQEVPSRARRRKANNAAIEQSYTHNIYVLTNFKSKLSMKITHEITFTNFKLLEKETEFLEDKPTSNSRTIQLLAPNQSFIFRNSKFLGGKNSKPQRGLTPSPPMS